MGLVVCLLKWIFYFTNQTPYHNFSLLCSRSTVLKKSHVQILWGQFKSFVVVQVNNNNSNCCCCGWGRFFRPSSYHTRERLIDFLWATWSDVYLFFSAFSCENPPKKQFWSSSSLIYDTKSSGEEDLLAPPSFVNPWVRRWEVHA